MNPTIYFLVC